MMNEIRQKKSLTNRVQGSLRIILFLYLLLVVVAFKLGPSALKKNCTIFTAVQGDTVLYGNSEDQHNPDPVIGFFPPSSDGYGSVHFGITRPDGQYNFEGAVNDQGLAWDCNSTPKAKLNPDSNPAKPYYLGDYNFLTRITEKAATVEEAIRIAKLYQFGDVLQGQYHIADASGDAVVISGGPDGKIAFTRKEPGDGYLLSTNFNLAQPEKGPVDFRWETAKSELDALQTGVALSPEYAIGLMESVHLKTLTTYTLYQNVLDLNENLIYLTYMSQFDEVAVIDMAEEFKKGQHVVEMREFFSPETAAAGDAAYRRFEIRFKSAIVGVLSLAAGLIVIPAAVILKQGRRRKRENHILEET